MKQAIHIFIKDVRRFWPVLSILLALWILHVSTLLSDPFSGDTESLSAALYLPKILQPGSLLLLLGLTYCFLGVLLIQEEALVGTTQFWLTRPIKRWAVPAAKAIFVFIFFVGVPVVAYGIVLLHSGMGAGNFISYLPGAFMVYLVLILLGTLIAVLTPNIHYFLLTLIIGILLLTVGVEILGLDQYLGSLGDPIDPIVLYAVGVLCLTAIFHQYRTRRTVRSAAIFVAGMLAVLYSFYPLLKFDPYRTVPLTAELEKIDLVFQDTIPGHFRIIENYSPPESGEKAIMGILDASPIPPACSLVIFRLKGTLQFPDGTSMPIQNWQTFASYRNPIDSLVPGSFGPKDPSLMEMFRIDKDSFARFGNEPATFSGNADFDVYDHKVVGRLPLEEGAFLRRGPEMVYIFNLETHSESFYLSVGTREISAKGKPYSHFSYYVVGTAPGDRLSPSPFNAGTFNRSVFPGGMGLKYLDVLLEFEQEPREWLSKGELLVIQTTVVGRFTKKFEAKTFRMADYTLEAWRDRSMGEISPDRE